MKRIVLALAAILLIACLAWPSGITQSAYNLIENAGSALTRRTTLNFAGTGVSCADNSGSNRTDCTITAGVPSVYQQTFTSQTSVTLAHMLGTTAVLVQCFTNDSPPLEIGWDTLTLTDSNDATVTFQNSQSGFCNVI
jgi:hypothetical protein